MIKSKLVPLKSVLKDIYLLFGNESMVSEDIIMEFAIRGMEHLAVNQTYERAVCVIPVVNCQAQYPGGMYGIHAVLGNLDPRTNAQKYLATSNTTVKVDEVDKTFEVVTETEVSTAYKILDFKSINLKQNGWFYLELSDNAWDRSILCNLDEKHTLVSPCKHWFLPDHANSRFIVSFDTGYIAVAYYRFPQDDKGNFLITDHPLVAEALESYVLSKIYQRLWHASKQGSQQKYYHYLEKWQQLAAGATGELMMLSLPDYINLDKQNRFFKDESPTKIYGGWGKERHNLR